MPRKFPALCSTLSPQALSEHILPGFGIGDSRCEFYNGGFNDTYRVQTAEGRNYYLRCYRPIWRSLSEICCELDALNHLKAQGYPAAQPVMYQDGRFYCQVQAPEGARYLALFTEAQGVEVTYEVEPEATARRYGQAVARMHNALDGFTSAHARFTLDLAHFIDQPVVTIEPYLRHRPEDWKYVNHYADCLRQHLLALPVDRLQWAFCHGDLQGYHANVGPGGTLTFYDFDCGGFGYRAYDLAVFLWCCRLQDSVAARWQPFLQGYQEQRSLPELDERAVPLLVCARYLWHMGVHAHNAPQWGVGFLNNAYYDDHLKRLKQAETDYLQPASERTSHAGG